MDTKKEELSQAPLPKNQLSLQMNYRTSKQKVLRASTNFSPVSNNLFGIYTNVEFLTCQVSVL